MLRIMSFNIWGDYFGNPVEEREDGIGKVISDNSPDILALQEATRSWHASKLFSELKNVYAFVEPETAPEPNYVPLLYRKDRFSLLESGFIRFYDTPDQSKGSTWGVFEDLTSRNKVAVFCTHFWWKYQGELSHDLLRVSNAALLTDKALEITARYDIPAVALGDLNSPWKLPTLDYLRAAGWKLAQSEAPESSGVSTHHGDPVRGEDGRYHGRRTSDDYTKSLDHIVFRGSISPVKFSVIEDQTALDVSDHSPIYCDFEI